MVVPANIAQGKSSESIATVAKKMIDALSRTDLTRDRNERAKPFGIPPYSSYDCPTHAYAANLLYKWAGISSRTTSTNDVVRFDEEVRSALRDWKDCDLKEFIVDGPHKASIFNDVVDKDDDPLLSIQRGTKREHRVPGGSFDALKGLDVQPYVRGTLHVERVVEKSKKQEKQASVAHALHGVPIWPLIHTLVLAITSGGNAGSDDKADTSDETTDALLVWIKKLDAEMLRDEILEGKSTDLLSCLQQYTSCATLRRRLRLEPPTRQTQSDVCIIVSKLFPKGLVDNPLVGASPLDLFLAIMC